MWTLKQANASVVDLLSYKQPYGAKGNLPCRIKGCDRMMETKGLCRAHYSQAHRGDKLQPIQSYGKGHIKDGYRIISVEGNRILEHRHVMQQHLDRELLPHENVHHINGNREDNRLENLELWSTSQPSGQRVEEKLSWARDIIKLYGTSLEKEASCVSEAEEIQETMRKASRECSH